MIRSVRRALKRLTARALAFLLGGRRGPVPALLEPTKILVIRIDERVGNVLLTTPLLSALRVRFPTARIDVLLAASKVSILDATVSLIPLEKRDLFRRPWAFVRVLRTLRAAKYDVAIDASHWHHFSVSSAALLAWTGATLRIAHARGDASRFATHAVAVPLATESEIATKLRLLGPLGANVSAAPMSTALGTRDPAAARIGAWVDTHAKDRRLVGLSPGARKPDHRVDPAVFEALAQTAAAAGATPIVLWGPGEEALAGGIAERSGALLAPPTDLAELAALMRRCHVIVTNDTGPMHLAVACGTPTIALFLRADPDRWGHHDPPHQVLRCDDRTPAEIIEMAVPMLTQRLAPD